MSISFLIFFLQQERSVQQVCNHEELFALVFQQEAAAADLRVVEYEQLFGYRIKKKLGF